MSAATIIVIILGGLAVVALRHMADRKSRVIVRSYKVIWAMEADMRRMVDKGWTPSMQTAAPGFITGTRSYTVTYTRETVPDQSLLDSFKDSRADIRVQRQKNIETWRRMLGMGPTRSAMPPTPVSPEPESDRPEDVPTSLKVTV
jgi:hypothetical protein